MKKITVLLGCFALLSLVSCSEKEESNEVATEHVEEVVEAAVIEEVAAEEVVVEEVVESKFHYDQDWDRFKEAVINQDLQGVGAFASSDAVDAQIVIDLFADPEFLDQLKAATYDDLTVNDTEFGVQLEFSASLSGSDEEGNEYESGVYLYFSQGETSLELDNILAAG